MTDKERRLMHFAMEAVQLSERKRILMKNIKIIAHVMKDNEIVRVDR